MKVMVLHCMTRTAAVINGQAGTITGPGHNIPPFLLLYYVFERHHAEARLGKIEKPWR